MVSSATDPPRRAPGGVPDWAAPCRARPNLDERGIEMKSIRVTGACMLVVMALGGVSAASASAAAPEFGRCVKKAESGGTGYSDSKCTKAVEGSTAKYEWLPGAVSGKNSFTLSGGAVTWATKGGKTLTCTSANGSGEYSLTNPKREDAISLEFQGCKTNGFGCTTTGRPSGDIVFNELAGEVGYENLEAKNTALKLEPGPTAGGKFIEFKCVGLEVKVRGKEALSGAGILVPIKNDVMTSTTSLVYKQTKGVQKPVVWEGTPTETYLEQNYENLGWEQSGWTLTMSLKNAEEMEYELNLLV